MTLSIVIFVIAFLTGFYFGFFVVSLLVAAGRKMPEKNEKSCPVKRLVSASEV